MAFLIRITCSKCGQKKDVNHASGSYPPDICGECRAKAEAKAKRAYFAKLAKLSDKQRLRKIEEFIYEHQKNHPRMPMCF